MARPFTCRVPNNAMTVPTAQIATAVSIVGLTPAVSNICPPMSKCFVPVVQIEITLAQHYVAPLLHIGVARVARIGLDYRESEVQIGVLQFFVLQAGRTLAATVVISAVRAVEVLGISQSETEFTYPALSGKELRMGYTSLARCLPQLLLDSLLSYDFRKQHPFNLSSFRL